jgi:hypothetical protein
MNTQTGEVDYKHMTHDLYKKWCDTISKMEVLQDENTLIKAENMRLQKENIALLNKNVQLNMQMNTLEQLAFPSNTPGNVQMNK